MYELSVPADRVQGAPPIMPRHVEVWLEGEESLKVRQAAAAGELFVRLVGDGGERLAVTGTWQDPHTPERLTLFLG